jgi:PDZ domain-containing protein
VSQRTESGTASAQGEQEPPRDRGLSRRTWTLVVSLSLVVVLGVVGALVRVPFVAIGPGPTFDTLGSARGTTVVSIDGTKTYRPSGQLRMVTVSLTDNMTLFGALGMWLSGREALVPREVYFPPGTSERQVERKNVAEMRHSQSHAEVAALRLLHKPIDVHADRIVQGSPADGNIKPGDILVKVDGKKIVAATDPGKALQDTKPGDTVPVTVRTPGRPPRTLHITLGSHPGREQGFLGLTAVPQAAVPFHVDITLKDVGGPSAGMMFALAVIDKLTPGNLSGGRIVAGTGEINTQGKVGPIGGIPFKMIAAREAGASVFLVPSKNCAEAAANAPDGLRLVRVTTLSDAVHELKALKAGKPVPSCG